MATIHTQPELEVTGKPNLQYELGDLLLNVWVDFIHGEWRLQGIALSNSQVDLQSMFSREQLRELSQYIDEHMPTAEEMNDRSDEEYDRRRDRELDRSYA